MLEDLPSGRRVFVDSNIFIYHFLDISDRCTAFVQVRAVIYFFPDMLLFFAFRI